MNKNIQDEKIYFFKKDHKILIVIIYVDDVLIINKESHTRGQLFQVQT
jgi:hypothetical protein